MFQIPGAVVENDFEGRRVFVLKNPTEENAVDFFVKSGAIKENLDPELALASIHRSRLQWLEADDDMLFDSLDWLLSRGFETKTGELEPLTSETRDEQRRKIGLKPL